MSQRDGFSSGFFLGTVVGGMLGGVIGALLAAQQFGNASEPEKPGLNANPLDTKSTPNKKRQSLKASNGQSDIESARRSLEDKIAQLNEAIDDVRGQLSNVNGGVYGESSERSTQDPRRSS